MLVSGGKSIYGARIGILMLEAQFPRIPGDMGNAETWPFPVLYKIVRGATPDQVVRKNAEGTLDRFIAAAEELAKEGIEAEVIDLMSLRPIDYDTIIQSAKKTNRVLMVEESWPLAGMASEIAYYVQRYAFDYLDAPVMRITGEDVPMSYSPPLVDAFLPNPEKVIKRVKDLMYIKN